MVRSPSIEKNGLKKGAWSEEEDNKLRAYVLRYGHWNWRLLPKFAGLSRCGKSCRLRWLNYLKPGLKRGPYSKEEEEMIIKLHEVHGSKWSVIAAKLPGRTDNAIKNYWHTRVKKFKKQDPNSAEKTKGTSHNMHVMGQNDQISSISPSKSTDQEIDQSAAEESFPKFFDNIWSEPFSPITSYSSVSSGIPLQDLVNGGISLDDSFAKSFEKFSTEPVFSNASNGLISPSTSSNISSVTNSEEASAEEFWSFWTEPFLLDTFYNPMDERVPLTSYFDFNDGLFYQC